jgi:hypothetical protein
VPRIRIGKYAFELPKNRAARIGLGAGLVVGGGLFGFLPVLGYWMVPVGLVILATDSPPIRRFNRRTSVAILGWWRGRKAHAKRSPANGAAGAIPPGEG